MERRKKIIAIFRKLDFQLDISQFDDRLIAQKIVCLLELKGLKLGYPYSIYVRGPYSPDLTMDLYQFTDEFQELKTESRLNSHEKEAADNLNRLFGLKPVLLEVGATYGYYVKRENCNPLEALKRVKQLKPFYSQAQIATGVSKAKEYLFEPTAEDLEELRKETEPWQRAALRSMRQ
jgi:uncharacterized protein YwgA